MLSLPQPAGIFQSLVQRRHHWLVLVQAGQAHGMGWGGVGSAVHRPQAAGTTSAPTSHNRLYSVQSAFGCMGGCRKECTNTHSRLLIKGVWGGGRGASSIAPHQTAPATRSCSRKWHTAGHPRKQSPSPGSAQARPGYPCLHQRAPAHRCLQVRDSTTTHTYTRVILRRPLCWCSHWCSMKHQCTASMCSCVRGAGGWNAATNMARVAGVAEAQVGPQKGPYEQVSCWMCMLQGLHAGLQLTVEHHVNTVGKGQAAGVQTGAVSVLGDGSYCQRRHRGKETATARAHHMLAPQPRVWSLLWCQDAKSATAATSNAQHEKR